MRNFLTLCLLALILLFIFSCEKEEKREARYTLTMNDESNENDTRSGGHNFVFFERSTTLLHTLTNIYPQYVFNKTYIDSIVLIKILPEVDANINPGTTTPAYCYLYTVIIYNQNTFPSQFTAYAPVTNGTRRKITYTGGWSNSDVIFAEVGQNVNVYTEYFDLSCQLIRRDYAYRVNYVTTTEQYTRNEVRAGNNGCGSLYRLKTQW